MVLIWEKVPNYIAPDLDGDMPHPATPLYRLRVPGGWLLREEVVHKDGTRGPIPAVAGPIFFIADPDHTWEVEAIKKSQGMMHVAYQR